MTKKAILDIGKTHLKLQILDNDLNTLDSYQRGNASVQGRFLYANTDMIWQWIVQTLKQCDHTCDITAMTITTHGATAALINTASENEDGLVLPVLDYEDTCVCEINTDYNKIRPPYSQTYSPALPAGLNLGRQLYWQNHQFPEEFNSATHILMYPQYWAWRLCGALANEVTSLGCHTDLWEPANKSFSQIVRDCGWVEKMPSLSVAWDCLGFVTPRVASLTGLPEHCKIFVGMHDSNASYTRYLCQNISKDEAFTVVSTGTWTILMQHVGQLQRLDSKRDMLANVDIYSEPVCCARFMGGREYERICDMLGGSVDDRVRDSDIQNAISHNWMVTPDFSEGSGPFPGMTPQIDIDPNHVAPAAVATLYCALMIDARLDDLDSSGPIYIEGAFIKNPHLCALLAQLRARQPVLLAADEGGNTKGALQMVSMSSADFKYDEFTRSHPSRFAGLNLYRKRWYERIAERQAGVNHLQS